MRSSTTDVRNNSDMDLNCNRNWFWLMPAFKSLRNRSQLWPQWLLGIYRTWLHIKMKNIKNENTIFLNLNVYCLSFAISRIYVFYLLFFKHFSQNFTHFTITTNFCNKLVCLILADLYGNNWDFFFFCFYLQTIVTI